MTELVIERSAQALEPVGDGWTVYGRAVPYGVEQRVSDDGRSWYVEEFAHGAYSRDAAKGGRWVNLMVGHSGDDGDRFLGRCVEFVEQPDGAYAAFRLDRSHPLAEAARSGELTGWSVSAHVYRTRAIMRGGREVFVREVCGLRHVAATPVPQYAGAGVMVARHHELVTQVARPRLDAWRARGYGQAKSPEHEPPPGRAATRP
jgi:HK97 family phage prohead protease